MAQPENGVPDGIHFMDTSSTSDHETPETLDKGNANTQDVTNNSKDIQFTVDEQCQGQVGPVGDCSENSAIPEDTQSLPQINISGNLPEENKDNDKLGISEEVDRKSPESTDEINTNIDTSLTDCIDQSDVKSLDAISLADIKASFDNNQEIGDGDCKGFDTGTGSNELAFSGNGNETTNNGIKDFSSIPPPVSSESGISDTNSINPTHHGTSLLTAVNQCSESNDSAGVESESDDTAEKKVLSNYTIQPGELSDKLIEGPSITLPLSEISNRNSSAAAGNQLCRSESGASDKTRTTESSLVFSDDAGGVGAGNHSADPVTPALNGQQHHPPSSSSDKTANNDTVKKDDKAVSTTPTPTPTSNTNTSSTPAPAKRVKKTPDDFIFGKVLGEGSYSSVYLAKEVSTQREFAVKVCEKKHLIREKKTHFVMREKEVLMKLDHSFFIKLAYTFQDVERLYYVLTYARNGELLSYLNKLSVFDVPCTRFYSAEIVIALEYLQSLGIVHRDLKPENVLLGDDMHIKISDFGTSKFINGTSTENKQGKRKNSFVGTAEYVSPEVLNGQPANYGTDLWALACIVYQCLSSSLPFRSGNEYQTFQKILKLDYEFPEGFHKDAKDLVQKLLMLEPTKRLGMKQPGGMEGLKSHPFFCGIDWPSIPSTTPPKLLPYLPASANNPEFWGEQEQRTGFDDQRLAEIITGQSDRSMSPELEPVSAKGESESVEVEKLEKQRQQNQFHQFVENNLILRQGFVDKRKGFFARKRMLLLTEGPHLYYVDAHNKVLKGEIPWSQELRAEAKNFKIFFVHTPNRTYYLESRHPDAHHWVKRIQEVWNKYYGDGDSSSNKGS